MGFTGPKEPDGVAPEKHGVSKSIWPEREDMEADINENNHNKSNAEAKRGGSSPFPQDCVCPGVSNSGMTRMPLRRANSITIFTSEGV